MCKCTRVSVCVIECFIRACLSLHQNPGKRGHSSSPHGFCWSSDFINGSKTVEAKLPNQLRSAGFTLWQSSGMCGGVIGGMGIGGMGGGGGDGGGGGGGAPPPPDGIGIGGIWRPLFFLPADGGGGGGEGGGASGSSSIGIGGIDIPLFEAEALGGGAGGGDVDIPAGIEGIGIPLLDAEALGGWGILPCGIDGIDGVDGTDGVDGMDGVEPPFFIDGGGGMAPFPLLFGDGIDGLAIDPPPLFFIDGGGPLPLGSPSSSGAPSSNAAGPHRSGSLLSQLPLSEVGSDEDDDEEDADEDEEDDVDDDPDLDIILAMTAFTGGIAADLSIILATAAFTAGGVGNAGIAGESAPDLVIILATAAFTAGAVMPPFRSRALRLMSIKNMKASPDHLHVASPSQVTLSS